MSVALIDLVFDDKLTFMNPCVLGGAVGTAGAADEEEEAGDAGPGGGPYTCADTTAERASTERVKRMAAVSMEGGGGAGGVSERLDVQESEIMWE